MNPVVGARQARPMQALGKEGGWAALEAMFAPSGQHAQRNQPEEDLAVFFAALTRTEQGRELVEWLMDITFRQPFRATGSTFEETALLAATRQGIEGVGEVILAALRHGEQLLDQRNQTRSE